MGKEETGQATPEERSVLRLLTPVAKLYTARQAIASASEVLEAFGGAGYVEDTGLPRLLRDAQVLSIWEGTTNVLSLDSLRAIQKEDALEPFLADLRCRLDAVHEPALHPTTERVRGAALRIELFWRRGLSAGEDFLQAGARAFAYSLARSHAAGLLLEHVDWLSRVEHDQRAIAVAQRWCAQDLSPLIEPDEPHRAWSSALGVSEV